MEKLRWRIYNLIRDDDENDTASNIFDGTIITLIIVNIIMVIIDTFNGLPSWYESFAYVVEVVSVIIFTIEYLMRVWTSVYIYPNKHPCFRDYGTWYLLWRLLTYWQFSRFTFRS